MRNPPFSSVYRLRAAQLAIVVVALILVLGLIRPFALRAAPPAPVLVNPANFTTTTVSNYPPLALPYFQWQPVAGATSYRLQISNQIAFNTVLYEYAGPATKHLPTSIGSFPEGTLYWRVRVESSPSGVGDWQVTPWQFTRDWSTNNVATLLSPGVAATIEFFEDPIFSWTPVSGAESYLLEIDDSSDCQSPIRTWETVATRYTPSQRLANGNYYWCVIPKDPAGRLGAISEKRSVFINYSQAPQLLQPLNGSLPIYTPQFKWTAVKGAYAYKLYYSTDSTFQTGVSAVQVNQPIYTPPSSLPNDQNYYWVVTAVYGGGVEGPASAVWTFKKQWYQKPIVYSPRDNEAVNVQTFTWSPVREAAYYRLEGSLDSGFGSIRWSVTTPNTFYWRNEFPGDDWGRTIFFRVTPVDSNGNLGKASNAITYRPVFATAFVENIYPRYYYQPPSIATGNYTVPYNIPVSFDYTVDTPTFYWSRTMVTASYPHVEADRYRLEVSSDVNFVSSNWTYETQNLSATPTDGSPFVPISTTVYYWRVTPLLQSGAVMTTGATNQPWAVRIDTSRLVTPTSTTSPTLQRPPANEKAMDTWPSFDWLPMQGAVRYEFAMSQQASFSPTVYVTQTIYTHHTPNVRMPKGTYFWHVRALDGGGVPIGTWSETRRIIQAYETRWSPSNTLCNVGPLPLTWNTLIASDANEGGPYDLTTLYAAQDNLYWYVGFNVSSVITGSIMYGLYLDVDQTDGSGASSAPPGRPGITTSSYYQPEYAIYLNYTGTHFITTSVDLLSWDPIGGIWNPQIRNLVDTNQVGGSFTYSPTLKYAELQIPKTAVGDGGSNPFMLSLALFSAAPNSSTTVSDTVPDNGPNTSVLTEFKTIGDRLSLALPPTDPSSNPSLLAATPFMYAETGNVDWLRGFKVEMSRDPLFTSIFDTLQFTCSGCEPFVDIFLNMYTPQKFLEDNTLYWRYSIRHQNPTGGPCPTDESLAPPSEPHVFTKLGPVPTNLQTLGSYSTPTFQWNDVEGTSNYRVQWSPNPDFSSNVSERTTNHDSFTWENALTPGKYYWRVRMENGQGGAYQSAWSVSSTVMITLPTVQITQPLNAANVNYAPTFKWQTVLTPTGQPAWGSPYFHLQIATSPNSFGSPFEDLTLDTINWTPSRSYPDGTYYWRIAVRDANSNDGPFGGVYTFTKQYPTVTLISPGSGDTIGFFPDFSWTAVNGAARYRLQVATNPQFSPTYEDVTTDQTEFIATHEYATANYYWRVAILDRDNNIGPWTGSTIIVNPYPYSLYLPLIKK